MNDETQQHICDQITDFARSVVSGTDVGFILLVASNSTDRVAIASNIEPNAANAILKDVIDGMDDDPTAKITRVRKNAEVGERMECVKCKVDITAHGSPVCAICDPDLPAIIEGRAEAKTENLCLPCFIQHCREHETSIED